VKVFDKTVIHSEEIWGVEVKSTHFLFLGSFVDAINYSGHIVSNCRV